MRGRTSTLVTLAVAAVAVGLAVPALATAGPPTRRADAPGSGQSVIDWNRQLDHDPGHARRPTGRRPSDPQLRHAAGRRVRRGRLDHPQWTGVQGRP